MRKKVLIVDDVYFMRNLLKKELKEAGFETIIEAKNGKEGLSLYLEHAPDLVTMDIKMPDMSGLEVTRQILEKDPKAKILVITGSTEPSMKQDALRAGALDFLNKPFQPSFLWKKIDAILDEVTAPIILKDEELLEMDFEINPADAAALNPVNFDTEDDFYSVDSVNSNPKIENLPPAQEVAADVGIIFETEDEDDTFFDIPSSPDPIKSMEIEIETDASNIQFPEEYSKELQDDIEEFMLIAEEPASQARPVLSFDDTADDIFDLTVLTKEKEDVRILKPEFSEEIPESEKKPPIVISVRPPKNRAYEKHLEQDDYSGEELIIHNSDKKDEGNAPTKGLFGKIKGIFK